MTWKGKHIVIVGPAYPFRGGGTSTFNERLARELALNNKVSILTFTLQYPNFLFPGKTQYSEDPAPQDLDIDIALNSINPVNWFKIGRKYKKIKPDIILFRYWMPFFAPCFGTFSRIVKKNNHTKLLAITDNIIPHERHAFDSLLSKYFISTLDGALAMSKSVLNDLKRLFPKSIAANNSTYNVHPLYDNFGDKIDSDKALKTLNLPTGRTYLLFFGFIRKYKGLDWLIEAFSNIAKDFPNVDLIIAGEYYGGSSEYEELMKKKGLSYNSEIPENNRIHCHTHFISNEDVAQYFSLADLVVQPYKHATQSGVSQIAYHFEIPMIVTNVGGLSEIVPNEVAGWVCEPNVESLTSALREALQAGKIANIRQNLPELKKQYSWSSLVENLSNL